MEDLQERIKEAANRTWQAIGGDILRAAEMDSLPRKEVAECVGDCDYLEQYGADTEAVAAFRKLQFEERQEMLLRAFPLQRYGW